MNYQDICRLFQSFPMYHIYVGYSGGADSLAALLAARRVSSESGAPLTAVHFEHGLRGAESIADAEHCEQRCREWGIAFRRIALCVPEHRRNGESDESAARRLRLEAWRKIAGNGAENALIVLGHHRNDLEENFFLRLARGSGTGGLCGMRPVSRIDDMTFLRPLLPFSRQEIEAFLRENGITQWCKDHTNDETIYRRNFIRHKLLPAFKEMHPGAGYGLHASLKAIAEAADFLDAEAERILLTFEGGGEWTLQQWREIPAALQPPLLQKLICARLGRHWIPRRSFIERFRALLMAPENPEVRKLFLPDAPEFQLHFRNNFLKLVPTPPQKHARMWRWRENGDILWEVRWVPALPEPNQISLDKAYFDAAKLPDELLIADGEDGDHMQIYGGKTVKWKKLRIDRGIARADAPPLLRKPDGTILWSPGIRHGAEACVDDKTEQIVEFTYKDRNNGNSKTNYGTSAESHA